MRRDAQKKEDHMAIFKKTASVLLAVIMLAALASCGAKGAGNFVRTDSNSYEKGSYPTFSFDALEAPAAQENNDASYGDKGALSADVSATVPDSTRKMVYTSSIRAETKEFDEAIAKIKTELAGVGGYIGSSEISTSGYSGERARRYAQLTLRIPAQNLTAFSDAVASFCNVTNQSMNAQDVSDTYYDLEARLNSYKVTEERLLNMLKDAKQLEYLLQIEEKLTDVRYNIERLEASIRSLDNRITYSTLSIYLNEVIEYTEPQQENFWTRFGNSIKSGWQDFAEGMGDFAIDLSYAFPWLLLIAAIVVVIVILIKIGKSRRKAKREKKAAEQAAKAAKAYKEAHPETK